MHYATRFSRQARAISSRSKFAIDSKLAGGTESFLDGGNFCPEFLIAHGRRIAGIGWHAGFVATESEGSIPPFRLTEDTQEIAAGIQGDSRVWPHGEGVDTDLPSGAYAVCAEPQLLLEYGLQTIRVIDPVAGDGELLAYLPVLHPDRA